tara:strand:+ start:13477 stop:14628 length:1152 start_codon:yes stop_codon:yes gene_type:complete
MKIIIAPDSFKESLNAYQVAESIQKGFSQIFPEAEYIKMPLADGGEGTVDILHHGLGGEKRFCQVCGPNNKILRAEWVMLDNGYTALIEIAQASGLDKTIASQRNPSFATSYGTGELIKDALDFGVNKILLGLGGSATNDGGAGIVQALGGRLLDIEGYEIKHGGGALKDLHSIDLSMAHPRCHEVEFIVACDVENPLCGPKGASYVFGPQKGADAKMVIQLDEALHHFSKKVADITGKNHPHSRSFGAAGGAPLGLSLLFNLNIKPGIEMVLDALQANKILEGADLVITGEGQMDNQTLQGKTPYGIAKRAKAKSIPVIGISGSLGKEIDGLYNQMDSIFGTVRSPQSIDQVLEEAEENLIRIARNIAATLRLGNVLLSQNQ